jgi:hypothetical protein
VSEAKRLGLADIDVTFRLRGNAAHDLEQFRFAFRGELGFQLRRTVEVILNRTLVPAGDEDHLRDPGGRRLFHRVLD